MEFTGYEASVFAKVLVKLALDSIDLDEVTRVIPKEHREKFVAKMEEAREAAGEVLTSW